MSNGLHKISWRSRPLVLHFPAEAFHESYVEPSLNEQRCDFRKVKIPILHHGTQLIQKFPRQITTISANIMLSGLDNHLGKLSHKAKLPHLNMLEFTRDTAMDHYQNFYLNFSGKHSKIWIGVAMQYGDERNRFQGRFHENQKSSTSASNWNTATNKCAVRRNTLSHYYRSESNVDCVKWHSISALTIKPWLGAEGMLPCFWLDTLRLEYE